MADGYDWKITVKKFFTGLAYAGISFTIGYATTFLETEEFPVEYAGVITILVGVLHLVANWWKHKDD